MIYAINYLLMFNMVISAFLALRMMQWLCRVTPLIVNGQRSLFLADINEQKSFKLGVVRAGTFCLIVMTFSVLNYTEAASQIAGLLSLGALLVWRWLYFVKQPTFAMGALAIAAFIPILVIAKELTL